MGTMKSTNPATGEVIEEYDELSEEELERRLERAKSAFEKHRRTSLSERAAMMRHAAEILESEKEEWAKLMTLEMGKPIGAAVAEAEKCAWGCRYYAENAERFLADEPVDTGNRRSFVRYQPLGPVLAVMPWNFPFWQVFRFAAPAIMAGNVGLLKHASNVPGCALAIEEVFRRAGFREGVFQTLLIGSRRVAGVIDDPRVRAATLTGSEGAGSAVGARAGERIKKTVLELGGSDPFIVMPSADLEKAVETAVKARTINNGQSCIAAKRFIVHESIAAEFTQRFVERMETLTVGDPMDPATDIGPLALESIMNDLAQQVEETIDAGATLLLGGRPLDQRGWFYAPTLLTDIPESSPAYREELFGPVASLFQVDDVESATTLANATRFGLGSSAWTKDPGEQEAFIDGLEAGLVFINGMVASDPRLPFGGVKSSGYGRELSVQGIREFVNVKTVVVEDAATAGEAKGTE